MDRDEAAASPVAILVPVLRRPHRVAPFLEAFAAATPEPHSILFLATVGDAMVDVIRGERARRDNVRLEQLPRNRVGDYAKKINHGYRLTTEPFLFLAADDLAPRPGWLSAALALFEDPAIGVVGTQDLAPTDRARSGEHATHSLVRRSYVDEFGTIDERGKVLHEGYTHEYVDDEFIATAKHRGAFAFAPCSIVEHLHPSWGKAPMDTLYSGQRRRMIDGRNLFDRRRGLWTSR